MIITVLTVELIELMMVIVLATLVYKSLPPPKGLHTSGVGLPSHFAPPPPPPRGHPPDTTLGS